MYESLRKLRDRKETGEGGFTLVELLIVIVILGILAAIVVLAIGGLAGKSKTAACNAELKTIQTAEDAAYASTADANGNGATYVALTGAAPALWQSAGNAANLLKDQPTNWTASNVSATGYTLTGSGNCAGMTFTGP